MLGRFWAYLTTKCQTCSRIRLGIGVAVVAVLVAGVLMAAGAAGLAWTNTEKFCIGCHEMLDNVYAEPHSGLEEQRAWFGAYLDGFATEDEAVAR